MDATGRCLCGAVTYMARDVETDLHSCHCGMCRRWAGGPVLALSVAAIEIDGEENVARYSSSDWAERGFCKQCGSNLFYRLKEANHYVVTMGSFDDQSAFRLAGEIFIDDKPPTYDFAGDHPRLTGEEFMASLSDTLKGEQ